MDVLRKAAPNVSATIAYMPENLRLGQAIERFMAPPLPVIGCDDPAAFERLMTVLGPLAPQWHQVSLRTGEMMKHALNAFLGVSICFANELGNICDAVGADGKRVGEMLRLEPRVGPEGDAAAGPRLFRRDAGARHADAARARPLASISTRRCSTAPGRPMPSKIAWSCASSRASSRSFAMPASPCSG